MVDDDDFLDFLLPQMWKQVHHLAEQLSEPHHVFARIVELFVTAVCYQELPGKDVAAVLLEVLRLVRDELIDAL
jgi:hypothetical protein